MRGGFSQLKPILDTLLLLILSLVLSAVVCGSEVRDRGEERPLECEHGTADSHLILPLLDESISPLSPLNMMSVPDGRRIKILVDVVHAKRNNPNDYNLNKCDYEYYNSYSAFRLFRHLNMNGYEHAMHRQGPLTRLLLDEFDMLFVNVMHEDEPDFTQVELAAIHGWIEAGGALMVISEHTNAYLGAQKMNPVLQPLGLTIEWTAALDQPEFCTVFPGWILLRHHDHSHPINRGVTTLHMQSGGTIKAHDSSLRDRNGNPARSKGINFISSGGWGDKSGNNPPDYYGDGVYTEGLDERGPLPVVGVSEFGLGRVMVVGDQNMYGDAWLHFRHNFRHAVNGVEWLTESRRQQLALENGALFSRHLSHELPHGTSVGVDTRHRPYSVAKEAADAYYGLFTCINRDHAVTSSAVHFGARELETIEANCSDRHSHLEYDDNDDDDMSMRLDAIMFPSPTVRMAERDIDRLALMARNGKHIVLLMDVRTANPHAFHLLRSLAPSFSFNIDGKHVMPSDFENSNAISVQSTLHRPTLLSSDESDMVTSHLSLYGASLASVQSPWGTSFIGAAEHETNAAFGCVVTQSSTQEPDNFRHFQPANAVDANPFTVTHTAFADSQAWIEVDLGREMDIHRVVLLNRADFAQGRFRDLQVLLFAEQPQHSQEMSKNAKKKLLREARTPNSAVFVSPLLNPDNKLLNPTHMIVTTRPHGSDRTVMARYVRVIRTPSTDARLTLADQNVISLTDLQVITPVDPTIGSLPVFNAAHGSIADQSSSQGDGDPASHAVDGNIKTFSHTNEHDDCAWLRLDLGREVDIVSVMLFNRLDGWTNRLRDVTIQLTRERPVITRSGNGHCTLGFSSPSTNPSSGVVFTSDVLNPNGLDYDAAQLGCVVGGGVRARYVIISRRAARLQLNMNPGDRNVLSLCDVHVWARPSSGNFNQIPPPRVDIARIGRVERGLSAASDNNGNEGKLIVFLQDSFFYNGFAFAARSDKRPRIQGDGVVRLEYALLDWIRANAHSQRGSAFNPRSLVSNDAQPTGPRFC
eukprot:TRINITY_DN6041_c0_g1_i1.p1 TRINITY_DN6041_c0_g1~~TRINITY_DN6041_c0_g1_i1.p1  ORF type:complete len:1037 (+),score=135.24 TRINITY_DN6041_c0_g1_i1:187-3297(+)